MAFGLLFAVFIVEEMFVGPTDTILIFAYLNQWGLFFALLSCIFQFKASNYATEFFKKATDKTRFPYT